MESGSESSPAVFWKELYWFVVLCAAGVALALAVLPPHAARHRELLELEVRLQARNARLERQRHELEAAIHSVDSDPFYREAVYRRVLGVKKNGEEFLDRVGSAGR